MSLKTKRELCTQVLRRIGLADSVENPASEDIARIASIYDTKLEEWRDRDLVYWPNTSLEVQEIPVQAFDALVALMINESEGGFGRNPKDVLTQQQIEERLLRRLRRHTQMKSGGAPVKATYF